ncbi:MAG: murein biosynthesis integral membrane protein MurJ [Alphaproteobacteria bacterium]|nr:murein biosynthesis integral membrane protein MurJ [Alphaproteobacteria bacterium]
MNLVRSIATVGGYTIGSRMFGFVREVLTASFLGAGAAADALVVAIKLPSFFRRLFAEGAFNASFVPLFAGLLATKSKKEARDFAEQILTLWVGVLFLLLLCVELFLPTLMPLLVPGFKETPERLYYAIEFSRITFPFIFFISLTALYSGILNSLDKFAIVASSPMAGNMIIIAIVYASYDKFASTGYAFSWGIMACGILQWLWVWLPALKQGMGLRFVWPHFDGNVRRFFRILAPAAFGSGVVQINLFVGAFIASWLPTGAISYLNYADRLNQLPLSVIGVAVSTALLPILSRHIRAGAWEKAHQSQGQALEFSMFLTLPAAVALIFLAEPFVMMVFERGKFTSQDTLATALTLQALAVGLPAYVLIKVFSSSFFARQDTLTPVYTACAGIVVDIGLSLALMGSFHQVGIAFATASAAWVNAIWLGYLLWRQGHLRFEDRLKKFAGRMILVCGGTIALLKLLQHLVHPLLSRGELVRDLSIAGLISFGLVGFLFLSHLMGALRFNDLKLMFSSRA